jgi:prepilin-type N-terminal cleavage/methylation domain-containing protein
MRAFTLIELIFVIVIIGIMAGVGMSSFKPTYLIDDVHFIQSKIQEAQFRGIGYEHNDFGSENSSADYNNGCIDLSKTALQQTSSETNTIYKLHVDDFDYGTLCFDSKGRPHRDNFTFATLLDTQMTLNLTYSNEQKDIFIEPRSGYAIIKHY